jgi:hypothetical protein
MNPYENRIDLRPPAMLSVGITGHRSVGLEGPAACAISASFDELFSKLMRGLNAAIARDSSLFSGAPPVLWLVGMAAEGADLLSARSARSMGAHIGCVLPYSFDEYKADFTTASALKLADELIAGATATFVLPGTRAEGNRAYERANETILANIEILIAVWNGRPASGRAGTGDVVQAAIAGRIPVIIIDPEDPKQLKLLRSPRDEEFENPIAIDLAPKPLADDLAALVAEIVLPPRAHAARRGLVDLMREQPRRWSIRFEYPLLLDVFGVRKRTPDTTVHARPAAAATAAHGTFMDRVAATPAVAGQLAELGRVTNYVDHLASHYALMFRSSTTSGFLAIIIAALISSLSMVAFPDITGASIGAQLAVNALVLADERFRERRRWHERWLDYRLIAERLRLLCFLHPLGLGLERMRAPGGGLDQSWVQWYIYRTERGLGAPTGEMLGPVVAGMWRQLVDAEIPEQTGYHRKNFGQLGDLERRLTRAATIALYLTFAVAALFAIWAYAVNGFESVSWRPFAIVILFVLPAMTAAFSGLRADADLVRLVERSAMTISALARLRRAAHSRSPNYDRVVALARRIAVITGQELSEWRFVLESRRARVRQRNILGRARFSAKLRRWLFASGTRR